MESAWNLQPNFQKGGGLDRNSTFRGSLLRIRAGDVIRGGGGGCSFHIKNKPKSEIFNGKKVYEQKYFLLS